MKNLFLSFIGLMLFSISDASAKNFTNVNSETNKKESLPKRHFEGTITLSGGCKIKYSIDIDYQLIPPRVNSIHGSLTMSGNCSGTQTFRASANTNNEGTITSVETDLKGKELESEEFKDAFVKELNELNIFEKK